MSPLASQILLGVIVWLAVVFVAAAIAGANRRARDAADENAARRYQQEQAKARARADLEQRAAADLDVWDREVRSAMRPPYDQDRDDREAS